MASCKDCVHVEVCCSYLSTAYNKCKLATPDFKLLKNIECDECQHFKDRSRFVELPCKVGDRIFVPTRHFISEYEISYFHIGKQGVWFNSDVIDGLSTRLRSGDFDDIGKTVFLTRKEAEQALKERENNG